MKESDKDLLKYYLHSHQIDTLLQCLVSHQVVQVCRDSVRLYEHDTLSARESLQVFYQAL